MLSTPPVAPVFPLQCIHTLHVMQVNGFAMRYIATNDSTARAAVENFFSFLSRNHSYATGGSNCGEGWGQPNHIGDVLADVSDLWCFWLGGWRES